MKVAKQRAEIIEVMTLSELCRFCRTDDAWVIELVQNGVLEPHGRGHEDWTFRSVQIARAKKARRLNRDLGVNVAGLAVILDLLDERDALRRRLAWLDERQSVVR